MRRQKLRLHRPFIISQEFRSAAPRSAQCLASVTQNEITKCRLYRRDTNRNAFGRGRMSDVGRNQFGAGADGAGRDPSAGQRSGVLLWQHECVAPTGRRASFQTGTRSLSRERGRVGVAMSGVKYLLNACELTAPAGVNPPSTDRNIPPRDRSQLTCATCSYFPSTACTNLDGPIQTTANSPACRLYFNIGDVERGL